MKKNKITDRFPFVKAIPPGFVTLREFSEMAGVSENAIRKNVKASKFKTDNIYSFQHKSGPPGIVINWNAEGTEYVHRLPKTHRPADYVPGQPYKPIAVEGVAILPELTPDGVSPIEARKLAPPPDPADELDAGGFSIEIDLTSARMRQVQIKNRQQEIELQILKNEVLRMGDMRGLMRQIAVELRSSYNKLGNKIAPDLAAESDPKKIKRILAAGLKDTLGVLGKVPGGEGE